MRCWESARSPPHSRCLKCQPEGCASTPLTLGTYLSLLTHQTHLLSRGQEQEERRQAGKSGKGPTHRRPRMRLPRCFIQNKGRRVPLPVQGHRGAATRQHIRAGCQLLRPGCRCPSLITFLTASSHQLRAQPLRVGKVRLPGPSANTGTLTCPGETRPGQTHPTLLLALRSRTLSRPPAFSPFYSVFPKSQIHPFLSPVLFPEATGP